MKGLTYNSEYIYSKSLNVREFLLLLIGVTRVEEYLHYNQYLIESLYLGVIRKRKLEELVTKNNQLFECIDDSIEASVREGYSDIECVDFASELFTHFENFYETNITGEMYKEPKISLAYPELNSNRLDSHLGYLRMMTSPKDLQGLIKPIWAKDYLGLTDSRNDLKPQKLTGTNSDINVNDLPRPLQLAIKAHLSVKNQELEYKNNIIYSEIKRLAPSVGFTENIIDTINSSNKPSLKCEPDSKILSQKVFEAMVRMVKPDKNS